MMRTVHIRNLVGYVRGIPPACHAAMVSAVRRTVKQRGRVIVDQEINATRPYPPVDRGSYRRSWHVIDIPNGVRIASTSPYASVIDHGRRPGSWSNIQALTTWVKRHGMDGDPRSIAFAIAAAIKKRGLPAKKVFERAAKRLIAECRQTVKGALVEEKDG
jgi:hypothetical protein